MADNADQSDAQQQALLEAVINKVRQNTEIPVNTTGRCYTCDEPVPDGRRWCDADCRDAAGRL